MNNIGRVDEMALADARARAHKTKQMVTEGGDPKVESHRFKDVPTFAAFVAERYLPYAKTRKRSWGTDETMLSNHLLPVFAEFRMNRVTRSDVMTFHHAVFEKGYATEWSPLRITARASAICRRRKWAECLMSSMPTAMCRWVR